MKRAIAIALLALAQPALAKEPDIKEPIIMAYAGEGVADAVAVACIERGLVVSDRTAYELQCTDITGDPQPAATFVFAKSSTGTLIQVTTKEWIAPKIYSQSRSLARKVSALLIAIGAVPKP